RARGGLRGQRAVPLTGDEPRVRVLVREEQDELVVLESRAEPDTGGAEPHEGDVRAVVRSRDAGSAEARQEQSALGRIEDRMAVRVLEQRGGLIVLPSELFDRSIRLAEQLLAPLGEDQV